AGGGLRERLQVDARRRALRGADRPAPGVAFGRPRAGKPHLLPPRPPPGLGRGVPARHPAGRPADAGAARAAWPHTHLLPASLLEYGTQCRGEAWGGWLPVSARLSRRPGDDLSRGLRVRGAL